MVLWSHWGPSKMSALSHLDLLLSVMLFPRWRRAIRGFRSSDSVDEFMTCAGACVHQCFLMRPS